jgi:hypothetical protein
VREPSRPENKELQDLLWGAYKQVQRLRSQWPPSELRETLPAIGAADQRTAQASLLEGIQEHLRRVQRDLESLQREAVAQERLRAAAQGYSEKPPRLSISSPTELFEAVRLGIVDIAEARQLLGFTARDADGSTEESA